MLKLLDDPTPARRLRDTLEPSGSLVSSYVPAGFAFYARILNPVVVEWSAERIPWTTAAASLGAPLHPWMQWDEVALAAGPGLPGDWSEPAMGDPDESVARALVEVLTRHTSTPAKCYFAHWEGYGGPPVHDDRRVVFPPDRAMLSYSGPLDAGACVIGGDSLGPGPGRRAERWWPEDLGWCVGQDIYARSLLVGCSAAALQDLFSHPALDIISVRATDAVLAEDF